MPGWRRCNFRACLTLCRQLICLVHKSICLLNCNLHTYIHTYFIVAKLLLISKIIACRLTSLKMTSLRMTSLLCSKVNKHVTLKLVIFKLVTPKIQDQWCCYGCYPHTSLKNDPTILWNTLGQLWNGCLSRSLSLSAVCFGCVNESTKSVFLRTTLNFDVRLLPSLFSLPW